MKNQVEEPAMQQYSTNIYAYDCKYIQQSWIHKSTMAMNSHDTKYDMRGKINCNKYVKSEFI